MTKKSCVNRACNLLKLALLWTKKGGVFKRRLAVELPRLGAKYLKNLGHTAPRDQIHYGERELSFDKSPNFHVKMPRSASMRFLFPCISAKEVDFEYDFGDEGDDEAYGYDSEREINYLEDEGEEECGYLEDEGEEESGYDFCEDKALAEEEEIDSRAEEFIAQFYKQIKLQRQKSYLDYTETLNRGAS